MDTAHEAGKASVVKASKPIAKSLGTKGSPTYVANLKGKIQHLSTGKMASVPHVSLGTSHGNHSVAHAVNGKSMSH